MPSSLVARFLDAREHEEFLADLKKAGLRAETDEEHSAQIKEAQELVGQLRPVEKEELANYLYNRKIAENKESRNLIEKDIATLLEKASERRGASKRRPAPNA